MSQEPDEAIIHRDNVHPDIRIAEALEQIVKLLKKIAKA